jgi:hypothetical protein
MMTTGILSLTASCTGRMRARSSSGARTMPSTPRLMKSSTTVICWARSSSFCGPFQMTSTPSSRAASMAPAWMLFQNSWVVPLGMTAIWRVRPARGPEASEDFLAQADKASARHRHPVRIFRERDFMSLGTRKKMEGNQLRGRPPRWFPTLAGKQGPGVLVR